MPSMTRDASRAFNETIIAEFRANGGRIGGALAGTPMILLHHRGARSGIERVTPLACHPLGNGRYAIVAANGGSRTHPAWYHNLLAHPQITVEYGAETEHGAETFAATATALHGAHRTALWPTITARYPDVHRFQSHTTRQIPVLLLTRHEQ